MSIDVIYHAVVQVLVATQHAIDAGRAFSPWNPPNEPEPDMEATE